MYLDDHGIKQGTSERDILEATIDTLSEAAQRRRTTSGLLHAQPGEARGPLPSECGRGIRQPAWLNAQDRDLRRTEAGAAPRARTSTESAGGRLPPPIRTFRTVLCPIIRPYLKDGGRVVIAWCCPQRPPNGTYAKVAHRHLGDRRYLPRTFTVKMLTTRWWTWRIVEPKTISIPRSGLRGVFAETTAKWRSQRPLWRSCARGLGKPDMGRPTPPTECPNGMSITSLGESPTEYSKARVRYIVAASSSS